MTLISTHLSSPGLTRRRALALAGASLLVPTIAKAELVIDLRGGSFQPLPIAIADFAGEGGVLVSGVITNNLRRCGYFTPIDKGRHPDKNPPFDSVPQFEAWKAAGVQALVTGRVSRDASGRIKAEFRLWDVTTGTQTDGQQYFTDPSNNRRVGHIISDAIFSKITGVGGFFDTRVVFVDESGPKENRRKRLAIMDQDGANVRYLTDGSVSVVTPRY